MDGWMDPAMEALPSAAIESNIDLTLHESRVVKLSDPSLATDSELLARSKQIRLGADHGVYLREYFSALALWRHTEPIKVYLLVKRGLADLRPAGLGCG